MSDCAGGNECYKLPQKGHLNGVSEHTDGILRAAIDDLRDATFALGTARDGFGWDEHPRARLEDQIAALDSVLDELERFYDDLYGLRSERP